MSFTKAKRETIKKYILDKISEDSGDIVHKTTSAFNITRNTVYRYLKELSDDQIIKKDGRRYSLNRKDHIYTITLKDIPKDSEDTVYENYLMPLIRDFKENVIRIWYYCFTEMMNNVIDHSQAEKVTIYVSIDYMSTTVILDDDGIGIFNKIKEFYNYPTIEDAILELFKGKLTTDSLHHSGEGIFFSSRIMDVFAAISSGKIFSHTEFDDLVEDLNVFPALHDIDNYKTGTAIFMKLSNYTSKTTKAIMDQYANVDGGFIRTIIPIKNIYPYYPVSRSQAKRLTHRFESFQEVQLDFEGVPEIGQGFAHELFVVFHKQHPEVQLIPFNANSTIQKMIIHVTT